MPSLENEIDAVLFQLIHQLSREAQEGGKQDRRGTDRQRYSVRQRIAPWQGNGFPPDSAFFDVQCHDLTAGGFSFLSPSRPEFTVLVAELGIVAEQIYLVARVVHVERVLVDSTGAWADPRSTATIEGSPPIKSGWSTRYLIGCRFVRRFRQM
jgi:hypothetical protein